MFSNSLMLQNTKDTVTEKEMALAMAKNGGIGILHRNLDAHAQASMVSWVRLSQLSLELLTLTQHAAIIGSKKDPL